MAFSVEEAKRAAFLVKKRKKEQEELEHRKKKIQEEMKFGNINNKFASHYDAVEQQLKQDTIGLVTLDEMKAKQEDVMKEREKQLSHKEQAKALLLKEEQDRKDRKRKQQKAALSFNLDEDEEEEQEVSDEEIPPNKDNREQDVDEYEAAKKKRLGMNPDVDTSFLPDRDREEEENQLREKLQGEWSEKQEKIKNEIVEIVYSYWDGSGHRRSVKMKKGNSIQQLLQRCLESLRKDFADLKVASMDQLMYVKEDLIIPHHYTFYDFIVTKARGKSGPLFSFDVHEDIRMINDASIEKDESHAGKVVLRSWYERHKHIFPASRWEPYNPEKKWDKYTVSDKEAAKIHVK